MVRVNAIRRIVMRGRAGLLFIVALAIGAPGCRSLPAPNVPLDARAGLFDAAEITYRVDVGRLGVPLAVARIEGQQVSFDELASSPAAGTALGTLRIAYPHPAGRAGMAQAEVTMESRSAAAADDSLPWFLRRPDSEPGYGGSPTAAREVWVLDISRGELAWLVERLQARGLLSSTVSVYRRC